MIIYSIFITFCAGLFLGLLIRKKSGGVRKNKAAPHKDARVQSNLKDFFNYEGEMQK